MLFDEHLVDATRTDQRDQVRRALRPAGAIAQPRRATRVPRLLHRLLDRRRSAHEMRQPAPPARPAPAKP